MKRFDRTARVAQFQRAFSQLDYLAHASGNSSAARAFSAWSEVVLRRQPPTEEQVTAIVGDARRCGDQQNWPDPGERLPYLRHIVIGQHDPVRADDRVATWVAEGANLDFIVAEFERYDTNAPDGPTRSTQDLGDVIEPEMAFIDALHDHLAATTSNFWDSDVSAIVSHLAALRGRRDVSIDALTQRRRFRKQFGGVTRATSMRDVHSTQVAFHPGPSERRRRTEPA
jgi:hypothetical protein